MAGLVTHLRPGTALDPTATFTGPWRSIETAVLDAGGSLGLDSHELESAIFVERGAATLALPHTTVVLKTRDAVTLGKGMSALLTAGDDGASLFIARLQAR
jgi:hypothetical protein